MRLKKKTIISFIFTMIVLIFGIFVSKLDLNIKNIIEKNKCPACYGMLLCQDIDDNKVTLEFSDFYSVFNNLLSTKNVFHGKYKNHKVIMKKLAYKSELEEFDEMVCNNYELFELCYDKPKVIKTKTNFYNLIISELSNYNMIDPNAKIRLCPTTSNANELLSNVLEQNVFKNEDYYKYLWSLIKINPEPIILQILSSNDKWPTPKYFGACGRLVIEEYSGLPLSSFINDPWIKRAAIASSLLDAAHMFTFKNSKFGFYLTDISMDNIVVNSKNKGIFVDLENIIIVDKYPPSEVLKEKPEWNKTHVNDHGHPYCEDCFIFSPADICDHRISDHNYYAICQHIFKQGFGSTLNNKGFLHSVPYEVLEEFPQMTDLLNYCANSNIIDTHYSRIDYGVRLKTILDMIVRKYYGKR